jgi:L-lactate dehydrogenase complex protein LldE
MLADKVAAATSSGADTLTACDMGCLMHIGGAISRQDLPIAVRHIAQILDGGQG